METDVKMTSISAVQIGASMEAPVLKAKDKRRAAIALRDLMVTDVKTTSISAGQTLVSMEVCVSKVQVV